MCMWVSHQAFYARSVTSTLLDLPKACNNTAKEEDAVSLDERRQEGKEPICGHANEEALSAPHFVRHPAPEERSNHHSQVNNTACKNKMRTFSLQPQFKHMKQHLLMTVSTLVAVFKLAQWTGDWFLALDEGF